MESHENTAFAENDLLKACDDIIQKSKFLKDTIQKANPTWVKIGLKKQRTNTRNLKVRQASCIKVRRCCRETLTNCYLICMNSKGNPRGRASDKTT